MVNFKDQLQRRHTLFIKSFMLIHFLMISLAVKTESSKITYKKALNGEDNLIKETLLTPKDEINQQKLSETTILNSTLPTTLRISDALGEIQEKQQIEATTNVLVKAKPTSGIVKRKATPNNEWEQTQQEEPPKLQSIENSPDVDVNVPCTCGVFLSSQIRRTGNPYEVPKGSPAIINELDRTFSCNAVGQKQCQTKCLENIVQHLPNSAKILCATLDRDIRKERAYLFIKNCRNQWFNTNLAAGREYCCKNGEPYQCPLL